MKHVWNGGYFLEVVETGCDKESEALQVVDDALA
jgi:hypothetical protein